jgi:tetratricopeptide (TPR) repeat protein
LTSNRGYGASYYNPYYAEPAIAQAVPYDYSQPIVVNNYVSSDADSQGGYADGGNGEGGNAQVQESPEQEQALSSFDAGLEQFKAGGYQEALSLFNTALQQLPGDPVVHEMRCLALFATGNYAPAAAGLNSLLAAAPGMDWTTMSGLYGDPDSYTQQLRSLEEFCQANPDDAPAHFVLAYHYLVTGSKEPAIEALRVVVKNQPQDATAKRMLDALAPPEVDTPEPAPAAAPTTAVPGEEAPETDLVGTWIAKAGSTQIELAISEDSQFTWKAISDGQESAMLSGNLVSSNDGIELETAEQGSMAGAVQSNGPDAWQFNFAGAPASDPGLDFVRSN